MAIVSNLKSTLSLHCFADLLQENPPNKEMLNGLHLYCIFLHCCLTFIQSYTDSGVHHARQQLAPQEQRSWMSCSGTPCHLASRSQWSNLQPFSYQTTALPSELLRCGLLLLCCQHSQSTLYVRWWCMVWCCFMRGETMHWIIQQKAEQSDAIALSDQTAVAVWLPRKCQRDCEQQR